LTTQSINYILSKQIQKQNKMNFLDALQIEDTLTENGMVTNSSTLNECVNLFFTIGAMRGQDKERLLSLFSKAFIENPKTALRILFWARDVRGGAGERQIFRDIIQLLAEVAPKVLAKNIKFIPEFGRWDDITVLFNTKVNNDAIDTIVQGLETKNGLCAKWMPRKGVIFNSIRKVMGLTPKSLRKMLVVLSKTVEQKMCANEWTNIEYSKVPSLAMARYTKAFSKHDLNGFGVYLESLKKGETKVNAGAVYPYDIVKTLEQGVKDLAVEQWKALPNFMEGSTERILPVVDVSGSMVSSAGKNSNLTCLHIAISLGLYISERNEGSFKDSFITFSERPQLQKLSGNLYDRYTQLRTAEWGMSTNLESVSKLILNQSIKHNVPQSEMPTKILILSDMEFNQATGRNNSAIQMIRKEYENSGYQLPGIIFWNIQSRGDNFPVRFDESGTALISGFSPSILKSILGGKELSPVLIMTETIESERYKMIEV
jgi:hypothetical protein